MRAQRLSAAGLATSDVLGSWLSPDGEWLVYMHDPETDEAIELYSVRRSGGTPVRLSAPLPAGVWVWSAAISPDSRYVVYLAAQETAGVQELWSVPIAGPGAAAVKLSPVPVAEGDVLSYSIAPDSSRVVIWGDLETNDRLEIWGVPIAGPNSSAIKLNLGIGAGGAIDLPRFTPDSARVVYFLQSNTGSEIQLWSTPIDGPAAASDKLSPLAVVNGNASISFILVAPDSSRVVYVGDFTTDGAVEVWSSPIEGPPSAAVKLNPTPVLNGNVVSNNSLSLGITPDGQRVVYYGDLEVDEKYELWSSPIEGPQAAAVKLNVLLCPDCDVKAIGGFRAFEFSSDGSRVVFVADRSNAFQEELWTVPVAGPAVAGTRLSPLYAGVSSVSPYGWTLSDDGTRVAFRGIFSGEGFLDLWSAELAGAEGNAVALADSASVSDSPGYPLFSPDTTQVIFSGDLVGTDEIWLFSRPADGSGSRIALTPFAITGTNQVVSYAFLDNAAAIYLADGEVDDRYELFRVPVAGGGSTRVSEGLPDGGDVEVFMLTPDRRGAVYLADGTLDEAKELWIADELIFAADFDEEADSSEWSLTVH